MNLQRRVHPHAQYGALRQIDFLALGRGNCATAADQHSSTAPFTPPSTAPMMRADSRTGAGARSFAADAFALDRLRHRATHRVGAAVTVT